MHLNSYVAQKKIEILQSLQANQPPAEGEYDHANWQEAKDLGSPQVGTARFSPDTIYLEYIYANPGASNLLFTVQLTPPERIVFMPVPDWVVETIWEGEIDGSYRFESEAQSLLESLTSELEEEKNKKWFEKRLPTTRK